MLSKMLPESVREDSEIVMLGYRSWASWVEETYRPSSHSCFGKCSS